MGTITGTSIINKVATLLYDAPNIMWSRAELLGWLNDAQRAMVLLYPETTYSVKVVRLASGTRQYIPADGWVLLTVTSFMGTDGLTRGRSLQKALRTDLDESNPNWYSDPAADQPVKFTYDERDRSAFDVYPPNTGSGYAEVIYSVQPTDLPTEASTIVTLDIYEPAIIDYMMFRALSKRMGQIDKDVVTAYYDSFMAYIGQGVKAVGKAAEAPE